MRNRSAWGNVGFKPDGTPLGFVNHLLRGKTSVRSGEPAKVKELNTLEAIRRLLLRVDAARAVSFLWPSDESRVGRAPENTRRAKAAAATASPTPLAAMLPILRRRTARRGMLFVNISRWGVVYGRAK